MTTPVEFEEQYIPNLQCTLHFRVNVEWCRDKWLVESIDTMQPVSGKHDPDWALLDTKAEQRASLYFAIVYFIESDDSAQNLCHETHTAINGAFDASGAEWRNNGQGPGAYNPWGL